MQDILDRMKVEVKDLEEKLDKIRKFSETETFKELNPVEKDLLITQADVMAAYVRILIIRYNVMTAKIHIQEEKTNEEN